MLKLALVALVLLLAFGLQGYRGIWEPDEGRYTNVALQMMQSGNHLTPMLHDDRPHFTKPPLTYWSIATSLALFGHSEWAARLPNSLAYLLSIGLLFQLGRIYLPEQPWLPPITYATMLLPFVGASIVTTDTLLTLWEILAVTAYASAAFQSPPRHRRAWVAALWIGFGFAFLTKGPPGLLPLLAILVFQITHKPLPWRLLFCPLGLAAFSMVAFSWYAAVTLQNPELVSYFIRYEFIERLASSTHQRNPQWYGAFAVYAPTLVLGGLPWIGFLLARTRRKHLRHPILTYRRMAPKNQLLVLWFFVPLVVLFAARSRLPLYILPIAAPPALASAKAIPLQLFKRRRGWILLGMTASLLLGLRGYTGLLVADADDRRMAAEIRQLVPGTIEEFVFVDDEPHYGLAFYFNAEVERVCFQALCEPQRYAWFQDEPMTSELGRAEPNRLLLVKNTRLKTFEAAMREANINFRDVGQVRGLHLLINREPNP